MARKLQVLYLEHVRTPKTEHQSMFAEHVWFPWIWSDRREAEKVGVERRMEASRLPALCDATFSSPFLSALGRLKWN